MSLLEPAACWQNQPFKVWGSVDTLQQFMSLRLKYLQSFLSHELKGNVSSKINVTPIVKAHLTLFTTEDAATVIHQLSALDLVIPCDLWAEVWSESLCTATNSKELIDSLSKHLKIDMNQFVKKMNVGMKSDDQDGEVKDIDKNAGNEKVNEKPSADAEARCIFFVFIK